MRTSSSGKGLGRTLFWSGILAVVGIGACVTGLQGILSGKLDLFWSSGGDETLVTFVGAPASWMGTALIMYGVGLLVLIIVVPRAIDARLRRASFIALPAWQVAALVIASCMFAVGIVGMVVGTFWRA